MDLTSGQRVHLLSGSAGTVSAVEEHRFRVSWDRRANERGVMPPRLRLWYPAHMADRFRKGNPEKS